MEQLMEQISGWAQEIKVVAPEENCCSRVQQGI